MKNSRLQKGFTLIELMIVIAIVAALAAIAIPSYRQYVVRNAESQAQSHIEQLQIQLNSWRATALSYRGFKPSRVENNATTYKYDDNEHKVVYVPFGSDNTNYIYKITLTDGESEDKSLVDDSGNLVGRTWKMIAEPRDGGMFANARVFLQHSNGFKCSSKPYSIEDLKKTADCKSAGLEVW